ncbi:MAG TPA: hypothetical protein VGW76_12825 [Pyrinomonadaceae bacterium]|nr:hypothetical protein [Pyrinomonadaceae bacterium]
MKKITQVLTIAAIAALFAPASALAQSSGNFTATVQTTQCRMNTTPGLPISGGLNNNNGGTVLETSIQTPNSKFTTLLIRPSLVTGLFTNTGANTDEYSGNSAAVKVYVTLDGNPVAPATSGEPGIIYDQRFQQLSLADATNMSTCTANNNCDVDLVMSTLAAHSFDFVAPNVGGGNHKLKVEWFFECTDNTGAVVACQTAYTANTAGACAGPGTVTVTQVKNFSQTAPIVIAP